VVFIRKPYYLLLLAGLIFLFLFFYTDRDVIILLDQYNLPSSLFSNYIRLLAVCNIMLWATYGLGTQKILTSKWMTWAHVILTLLCSIILVSYFKLSLIKGLPPQYLELDASVIISEVLPSQFAIWYTFILLLIAQSLFIIHLALGSVRYLKDRRNRLRKFSNN